MKVSYELKQGYIDVWNQESEEWDRYFKENKKSVVEEKKIPEKLEFGRHIENGEEILTVPSEKMIIIKINEIIDYLKDEEK